MAATFKPNEHIYDEISDAHDVKLNLPVRKGDETVKSKWKKAAIILLGLVCFVLLITVIVLGLMLSNKGKGAVTSI